MVAGAAGVAAIGGVAAGGGVTAGAAAGGGVTAAVICAGGGTSAAAALGVSGGAACGCSAAAGEIAAPGVKLVLLRFASSAAEPHAQHNAPAQTPIHRILFNMARSSVSACSRRLALIGIRA
jgi:hypothetical protein